MRSHSRGQKEYFDKEYSTRTEYKLLAWEKAYINRIKTDVLGEQYRNKRLVDIGSGSGYVAVEMAKLGLDVVACDFTPTVIENLNNYKRNLNLTNLEIIICKAEDIPAPDKSFDFIIANAILEHIPNEKGAIVEWKRILKPGGRLFITVPLKLKYVWPFFWPLNYIYDRRIGHLRRYDLEGLKRKFCMQVRKVYYTGHLIKVIAFALSFLHRFNGLEEYIEKLESKTIGRKYGASNIGVVMEYK